MKSHSHNPDTDELRLRIVEAARERFTHFGYGKTTMAEIAADCDCSAANLYRYFNNKQDIAAAVAQQCMEGRICTLREIVQQPGMSASERLRAFVIGGIEASRANPDGPKINELVGYVLEQRKDLVHAKIQAQTALIAEILAYGNETREFDIDDIIATARSVYAALTLFEVPIFQPLYDEQEFIDIANSTVDLLLRGLQRR